MNFTTWPKTSPESWNRAFSTPTFQCVSCNYTPRISNNRPQITPSCTGNRYPAELAFVLGDKTVAETLAEEEADRLAGKPEPEFVVERVMDELRVEVEGLKAPVKYFLVKWEVRQSVQGQYSG